MKVEALLAVTRASGVTEAETGMLSKQRNCSRRVEDTMTHDFYKVSIQTRSGSKEKALLTPATAEDMPSSWTFVWRYIWQQTAFDCENIIKLVYQEQVWGLVRYGLYPYPGTLGYLHIHELESNPLSQGEVDDRAVEPVGKWLIWYSAKVGIQYCLAGANDTLITLISLESALGYYRNIIEMQYLQPVNIASEEDGYAFRFSKSEAEAFCERQEAQWGVPTPLKT